MNFPLLTTLAASQGFDILCFHYHSQYYLFFFVCVVGWMVVSKICPHPHPWNLWISPYMAKMYLCSGSCEGSLSWTPQVGYTHPHKRGRGDFDSDEHRGQREGGQKECPPPRHPEAPGTARGCFREPKVKHHSTAPWFQSIKLITDFVSTTSRE